MLLPQLLLCAAAGKSKCCSAKAFALANGSAVSVARCQGPGRHRCCSKRRCSLLDAGEATRMQEMKCEEVRCCAGAGRLSPAAVLDRIANGKCASTSPSPDSSAKGLRGPGDTIDPRYKADGGQDVFVDQVLFASKSKGIYLDIGCNGISIGAQTSGEQSGRLICSTHGHGLVFAFAPADGIHGSNTWFLAMVRGWWGRCIEADPNNFATIENASGRLDAVQVALAEQIETGETSLIGESNKSRV